jgi:hypothetical protein
MNTSKFHLFSQGIVATDATRDSPIINITPIELVPYYNGGVEHKTEIKEHKGVDAAGNTYSVPVKTNNTISATWFNYGGTNRSTHPDVVKGERVFIYQYADEDLYYWDSNGQDDGLRQRETIIHYLANLFNRSKTKNDLSNAYEIKMSTHDKMLSIKTNKSDGEPYAYEISLDTKIGKFLIKDDVGNEFMLDSKPNHIRLKNKDNSLLELIGKIINIKSDSSVNIDTKDYTCKASSSVTITTSKGDYNIDTMNINGSKLNVKSNTQFNGSTVKHGSKDIGKTHWHKVIGPKTDVPEP